MMTDLYINCKGTLPNLLASTEIGTIFLDIDLRIKRFTPVMKNIFNLINADINRPISDITSNLNYDNLSHDAKEVLDTLMRKETELKNNKGQWYSIRIAPYRTIDNIIDGVVITFVDITKMKEAHLYAARILEAVREPLIILNKELCVVSANKSFYRSFHLTEEETVNRRIYDLGNGQWNIPRLSDLLKNIATEMSCFDDYEVEHEFTNIGRKKMLINARCIDQSCDRTNLILLAIEDITEKDSR
jgi:two-component system CheB/CheR fusion protein